MRTMLLAIAFVLCAPTASAEEAHTAVTEERTLTAQEVQRYAAVYYAPIRACYLQYGRVAKGATGELALKLVVHRDGYIHDVTVDAPGVKGRQLKALDRCIRSQVLTWHFPVRRDFTTAILPYYFMYLDIPSAGPVYSCWSPKGCPSRAVKPRGRE